MNIGRVYPKRVGPAAVATGSATAVFTADKRYGIERFVVTNNQGADATITLHVASSGVAAATGNRIVSTMTVPASDVAIIEIPIMLDNGDVVYAVGSSAINLMFNVNDVDIGAQ
jgi:hypothetical protein